MAAEGVAGLVPEVLGPKGPSRLSGDATARIVELRGSGLSLRVIGAAVGVPEFSVRPALKTAATQETAETAHVVLSTKNSSIPAREHAPEPVTVQE